MSLVVLTTAGGAPGVTTTALGLTLAWPRPAILVDADRVPTQAILAGYFAGADLLGRGLSSFAMEQREHGALVDVHRHCVGLEGHSDKEFLPGFATVAAAALFEPVWPALVHALAASGSDAIIDAGRLGSGLPPGLAAAADVVAVVARASLRSVAAQRIYLRALEEQLSLARATAELVVVGPGRPYASTDVAEVLRLPLSGSVAWDPARAGWLSDGGREARRYDRSALAASYAGLADTWVQRLAAERELVTGVRA